MSALTSFGLTLAGLAMEDMNKTIAKKNERIAALEKENADLRFNIGELMKAVAPSHTTNKEK
jgi:hypothetical protein